MDLVHRKMESGRARILPISPITKAKEHDNAETAKDDALEARANDGHDTELRSVPRQRAQALCNPKCRIPKDSVLW
jgi:hypothetical protein